MLKQAEILKFAIMGVYNQICTVNAFLRRHPNSCYHKGEVQKLNKRYTELRQMLNDMELPNDTKKIKN